MALVMLVGAVCGLYLGLTSGWQIAVESSQAVAGIVAYPADNPFYMYHIEAWTLLHQIPALLLAAGVSEQTLSLAIGCLAAVLSLQALALIGFAFSRDRWTACAMPVVYLATSLLKDCGAVYQIHITSDEYWTTYGVVGTAYALLVWSLIGVGWKRSAAFLCGLAPAVHPALGAWCIAMPALAWLFPFAGKKLRLAPRSAQAVLYPFAAGAAITAISFAIQRALARGLPPADPGACRQLLAAFVDNWDNHRFPVPLEHIEWQLGWCMLLMTSVSCAWFADKFTRDARLLLLILLASATTGMALLSLTHASHWLPLPLLMAMPGRFINVAVVAFPALLIGMLSRWRRVASIDALLAGLALFCFLRSLTFKQLLYVPAASKIFIIVGLALVYILSCRRRQTTDSRVAQCTAYGALTCLLVAGFLWRRDWHLAAIVWLATPSLWLLQGKLPNVQWPRLRPWLRAVAVGCLWLTASLEIGPWIALACLGVLALATRLIPGKDVWPGRRKLGRVAFALLASLCVAVIAAQLAARVGEGYRVLSDPNRDPALIAAAGQPGAILTAPRMGGVQLRTRRPVILNGEAMNQITYVPASGPAMNRILNRIYGDDLLKPRPAGWIKLGGLMRESAQALWQDRQPAEWQALGREFGFTNVLTYGDWRLKLPIAARAKKMTLYRIP